MTTPDTPDWVPPQSGVAVTQELFNTGPLYVRLDGTTTGIIDVSAWSTLIIIMLIEDSSPQPQIMLDVDWLDDGSQNAVTEFTLSCRHNQNGATTGYRTFYIPILSNSMQVGISADIAVNGSMQIVGSSRQFGETHIVSPNGLDRINQVAGGAQPIAAGQTLDFLVGPFDKGFTYALTANSASMTCVISAVTFDNAVWTASSIASPTLVSGVVTRETVYVPHALIKIELHNPTAGALQYDLLCVPVT